MSQGEILRTSFSVNRLTLLLSFTGYLLTVVGRLCLDHSRKKKPVYVRETPDCPDSSRSPLDLLDAHQEGRRVRDALARLPGNQRMAVILRYYEEQSYADIAEVLETTAKAVERLLNRARENLRKQLAADPRGE